MAQCAVAELKLHQAVRPVLRGRRFHGAVRRGRIEATPPATATRPTRRVSMAQCAVAELKPDRLGGLEERPRRFHGAVRRGRIEASDQSSGWSRHGTAVSMAQCAVAELKLPLTNLPERRFQVSMAQCAVAELKPSGTTTTRGRYSMFPWRSAPWPN